MVRSLTSPATSSERATELAERGWRLATITEPDGATTQIQVPLTSAECLHPQEGYHLPNSTFHDDLAGNFKDILGRRYASDPNVGVFRDLLIEWDLPELKDNCPDTFVAFGIRDKEKNRRKFIVSNEGVRPGLVLEVVSPRYRKEDREIKVLQYAQARVQEYLIIDRRTQGGQVLDEVLGYRLVGESYQPISPDEEGRICCETVGLWISLQQGRLIIEDAATGERLLSSLELEATNQELEATNQELEATNQELEAAKELADQQAAEMAALLARYQQRFGDLEKP